MRDLRRVRKEQRTRKRRADHSPFRWRFPTPAQGREQPSGPASGRQSAPNRGVTHAPAPSVTSAKCVSCAAQNAALAALPLSLQVVGVERLATSGFADAGSSPSASTDNLALQNCANHRSWSRPPSRRQPFRSESRDQSEKSVEKSLKFSRGLCVEFTAASTGLTLLARVADTL